MSQMMFHVRKVQEGSFFLYPFPQESSFTSLKRASMDAEMYVSKGCSTQSIPLHLGKSRKLHTQG